MTYICEHLSDHYISCAPPFAVKVTSTSWYIPPLKRWHMTLWRGDVQALLRRARGHRAHWEWMGALSQQYHYYYLPLTSKKTEVLSFNKRVLSLVLFKA